MPVPLAGEHMDGKLSLPPLYVVVNRGDGERKQRQQQPLARPSREPLSAQVPAQSSDSGVRWFPHLGFVGVRSWVPCRVLESLNAAIDREGSLARRYAEVISGGGMQLNMEHFNSSEKAIMRQLSEILLASRPVRNAAAALWGDHVRLRIQAR